MDYKKLVSKIKELRQIKPSQNWVILTKKAILEGKSSYGTVRPSLTPSFWPFIINEISRIGFVLRYKKALATISVFVLLFATFVSAQNALPGDLLYPLRKITEKSRAIFVSKEGQSKLTFDIANKRLGDLAKVAQSNTVKNLAPAINELKESVSDVAKTLTKEKGQAKNNPAKVKEIVAAVKQIENKKDALESLGIITGESKELDEALVQVVAEIADQGIVEREIQDLKNRTLIQEQVDILEEAERNYHEGNYSEALVKILLLSSKQSK